MEKLEYTFDFNSDVSVSATQDSAAGPEVELWVWDGTPADADGTRNGDAYSFTPTEARELAARLMQMADLAEEWG